MKDYSNYKKHIEFDMRSYSGQFHFNEQLKQEGIEISINGQETTSCEGRIIPIKSIVRNTGVENKEGLEERSMMIGKEFNIVCGDYIKYLEDTYIITTGVDKDNPFFNTCKMRRCNNILKWETDNDIYEYPCILQNDGYGVKTVSDNDYIRTQNIKTQIIIQSNEYTNKIIPDMRFVFNHSQFDIFNVVDINTSIINGLITLTTEKSILRTEDDLKNNLAYSEVIHNDDNKEDDYTYTIEGEDFRQNQNATFKINPLINCVFYIDEFDSQYIANIVKDDGNGTCEVFGKKSMSDNYFTLYAKDFNDNVLVKRQINVKR